MTKNEMANLKHVKRLSTDQSLRSMVITGFEHQLGTYS